MSDEDRRCGTCRWWGFFDENECVLTCRTCINGDSGRYNLLNRRDEGANCDFWARKESDDGEGKAN